MSKARTAFYLLLHPQRLGQVVAEKVYYSVAMPLQESAKKRHKIREIRQAAKVNFAHEGLSAEDFKKLYCRLEGPERTVLLFSLYVGVAGNLATTNYYTNWIIGLRENAIDAVWLAQEMISGPEIDIGIIDGPLLLAPYKDLNFNVQNILNNEKPEFILCHNNPVSLDFLENNDTHGAFKFVFIGDSMIPRIKDTKQRNQHIQRVLDEADGLIVVSQYLKKSWVEYGFNPRKIFVTKTPVDASAWPRHRGSKNHDKAAYFGNIYHKEIDNLLEIAKIVKEHMPSFTISIFGDGTSGDLDTLQRKIDSMMLHNIVHLHKSVSLGEMQKIQAEMDVLLLPRERAEFSLAGFPNKLGEYLASGCPTIVTRIGEIENIISDGEHAIIVDANDNQKFADAIVQCLNNYEKSVEMGRRGKNFISSYASPKTVVAEFLTWKSANYE